MLSLFKRKSKIITTEMSCQTDQREFEPCIIRGVYYLDTQFQGQEDQHTEFKGSISCATMKDIIAFANTNDGTIFYGIQDDGLITGVNIVDFDKIQQDLYHRIYDNIFPKYINYDIKFYQVGDNMYIIALNILKSDFEHSDKEGIVYYRTGSVSPRKSSPSDELQTKLSKMMEEIKEKQNIINALANQLAVYTQMLNSIKQLLAHPENEVIKFTKKQRKLFKANVVRDNTVANRQMVVEQKQAVFKLCIADNTRDCDDDKNDYLSVDNNAMSVPLTNEEAKRRRKNQKW